MNEFKCDCGCNGNKLLCVAIDTSLPLTTAVDIFYEDREEDAIISRSEYLTYTTV